MESALAAGSAEAPAAGAADGGLCLSLKVRTLRCWLWASTSGLELVIKSFSFVYRYVTVVKCRILALGQKQACVKWCRKKWFMVFLVSMTSLSA